MGDPTKWEMLITWLQGRLIAFMPQSMLQSAFFAAIPVDSPEEMVGDLTVMNIMERWGRKK